MAKPKINPKEFLLKKGEYLVLGLATLGLLILMVLGVSEWSEAKDPTSISKELEDQAIRVQNDIVTARQDPPKLPKWIEKIKDFKQVEANAFAINEPWFDPIAKPDTKRENPSVLPIGKYQVDLVRAPMKGFDIRVSPEGIDIGIVEAQKNSTFDPNLAKQLKEALGKKNTKGKGGIQQPPGLPMQPGFPMGPGAPGLGGPSGPGPGGPGGGRGGGAAMGGSPFGGGQGGFDQSAQRFSIRYIPLEDLDKEMAAGKIPAMTVIPLRMVVVHATFPIKKQIEECKRALRFPKNQALPYDLEPVFEGFEVRRRQWLPNGQIVGEPLGTMIDDPKNADVGWQNPYDYDVPYVEKIDSRKMADHFDVDPRYPDSRYLPYFVRYDQDLWMPLPELVTELASYPPIKIQPILDTIEKLKAASRPPDSPSELYNRLYGGESKRSPGKYTPQSGRETGAGGLYGPGGLGGPTPGGAALTPGGAAPAVPAVPGVGRGPMGPMGPGGLNTNTLPEIEDLLLRFIDCDVQPGRTYQYQIRVRMKNPNFGKEQFVAIPEYAKEKFKTLYGPWVLLDQSIPVPSEYFLYAYDAGKYRNDIEAAHKSNQQLLRLLQVKDSQAVIQIQNWMEQVRLGDRREPVGAWVVAEMPVGRGEFVGKKQYVKLPLWESTKREYQLREMEDKVLKKSSGGKEPEQPKGWLVDFTTKSILVDFEGGRVKAAKPGGGTIDEDAAVEMLILRPDGKLVVRNSEADAKDRDRTDRSLIWERWLQMVEQRKSTAPPAGGSEQPGLNPFGGR